MLSPGALSRKKAFCNFVATVLIAAIPPPSIFINETGVGSTIQELNPYLKIYLNASPAVKRKHFALGKHEAIMLCRARLVKSEAEYIA